MGLPAGWLDPLAGLCGSRVTSQVWIQQRTFKSHTNLISSTLCAVNRMRFESCLSWCLEHALSFESYICILCDHVCVCSA